MTRTGLCVAIVLMACVVIVPCAAAQAYPFQNPALDPELRITDLLSRMTLEEKIKALSTDPSVPRLGVKGSGHIEGLHGVALGGPGGWGHNKPVPTTQFPQSVGVGETWDPEIIRQAAKAEAEEARWYFQNPAYQRGGIVVRAPNADLARDIRWGRTEESYGEDPFLTGTMAAAFARGLQGDNPKYWEAASLLKHFMANSNENGRGGSSSNFDERLLREYYSVPFRMAVEQAHANAYMTAYNAVNHVPMTANPVLREMTMKQWGFNGIICTDAGALTNMVTEHHYYKTPEEAAAGAIRAGINQFLDKYEAGVRGALAQHLISEADIEENLRGVYRVMIKLGMLDPEKDDPYARIGVDDAEIEPWKQPARRELVRQVTRESIVLLKNDQGLLPLDRSKLHSIALIGPRIREVDLDWYSGTAPDPVSPLEGLRNKLGKDVQINFTTGNHPDLVESYAKKSDVAIVVVGNHPTCDAGWNVCPLPSEGKEAIDRKSITLEQEDLVKRVMAANPRTVVVLLSSFPYAINWTQQHVPAILHMAHNSEEEGNALADVLFGDFNPAGRVVHTWPQSIDQLPPMMDYDLRHGRTYMYFQGQPLYPFGYGLSYTKFQYSGLRVHTNRRGASPFIDFSLELRNSGRRGGDEVVQLYVKHLDSKVERPRLQLIAFQRVFLNAGEKKKVSLSVRMQDLAYWDAVKGKFVLEADNVNFLVGASSKEIRLQRAFHISNHN